MEDTLTEIALTGSCRVEFLPQRRALKELPGEKLRVKQHARGVDRAGYLMMDVLVEGDVPEYAGESVVSLAPFDEEYTQTADGRLHGRGRTHLTVGIDRRTVPVE